MRRLSHLPIVPVTLLLALVSQAFAQPAPTGTDTAAPAGTLPPDPDTAAKKDEAREHFGRARALADKEAWDAALAEFQESRKAYATWGNTLGAARCLQKLVRVDEAFDLFEILLRDYVDQIPAPTRAEARKAFSELRDQVGTIEILGGEADAAVTVDGRARGELPLLAPLRVPIGSHVVRVFKEGFEPFETRVDVAGGRTTSAAVRLRSLVTSGRLHVAERNGLSVDVLVDGNVVGKTPWEGVVSPGDHLVVLRGTGDVGTQPASVPIEANKTATITLTAESLSAALRVVPVPESAAIAIDSVAVGRGAWEGRLRPGQHTIEVASPGFVTVSQTTTLERGAAKIVRIALERDPSSPYWKKPPRPSHPFVQLIGAVPVLPSLGGDVAASCSGACSPAPATGAVVIAQGGYQLRSGLEFGLFAGYLFVSEAISGRQVALHTVGGGQSAGSAADTLALRRGAMGGLFGGVGFGDRLRFHAGLGAALARADVTDTRTGRITPEDGGPAYSIGPVTVTAETTFFALLPDVRAGLALGDHVELSLGVAAIMLFGLSTPAWDSKRQINAGPEGIGTFPGQAMIGDTLFAVAPSLGARYDF